MIWTIWLLAWIIIGSIPISTLLGWLIQKGSQEDKRYRSDNRIDASDIKIMFILRLIVSLILGVICVVTMQVDTTMWWAILLYLLISGIVEAFFVGAHGLIKLIGVIALIILAGTGIWMAVCSDCNNALYFDQFIDKGEGFPIVNEVPNNLLRLTTEDLARSIAKQRMSEFGSNVEIVDMQVTMDNGRLVWVAIIAQKEAWGATFNTEGMIIIDANNPEKEPEVIKDEEFAIAGGLSFNPIIGANGNAGAKGYFGIDTALSYGDAYPVKTPEGKWSIAITTYRLEFNGVHTYTGVYLLDKRGNIIDVYEKGNIPDWLIQPFDEQNFLEEGINDWGGTRKGNSFDVFAGGFLWTAPSNNRIKMTEDTRYVFDPDTDRVAAMVMTNPIRDNGEFSLAGAFKATSEGITYYDLSQYNLMSGDTAGDTLLSEINIRAGTEYYTEMELLYPLQVGNNIRQVWFVPIYFQNTESGLIGLAGLGLIDAQASNVMTIEYTVGGLTGADLVEQAKASFVSVSLSSSGQTPVIESNTVSGTLTAELPAYMRDGTTYQWLTLNTAQGSVNVLIKADLLTDAEMFAIQSLKIGDTIAFKLNNEMTVLEVSR